MMTVNLSEIISDLFSKRDVDLQADTHKYHFDVLTPVREFLFHLKKFFFFNLKFPDFF